MLGRRTFLRPRRAHSDNFGADPREPCIVSRPRATCPGETRFAAIWMSQPAAKEEFLARLQRAAASGTLVKLTLGCYRGAESGLEKLLVRPVRIREALRWSCVFRYATKDIAKNLLPEAALAQIRDWLGGDFQSAYLATTEATAEWTCRSGQGPRLVVGKARQDTPPDLQHDRRKKRRIEPQTDRWLEALNVTTAAGTVRHGMEAKFRQINQFLEILEPLVATLPGKTGRDLRLVDMGCGKGYLTFAACRQLQRAGWTLAARGIEVRAELVEQCNRVARDHGFTALHFECGTIASALIGPVDVLLALHACDTATDDALAKGIRAGASLILTAPCCHQEVRPQLRPPPALAGAFQHGILRERQAEWVTDALRAALLEWAGYETKVFEFIATEHTAKNLMIAAVKQPLVAGEEIRANRVRELAAWFGIRQQRLAQQLGFPLAQPAPATDPDASEL